jgi:transposase-like protein
MLRKIPVGEILAEIRTQLAQEEARRGASRRGTADDRAVVTAGRPPRRSGRAPLTPELLQNVAIAYLQENMPGVGPGAMTRLARRFGKPEETMRSWVARARRDGWLGPSAKGRAGAEPGWRLEAALLSDEGLIEIEPPDGAPTASDIIGVKPGPEVQAALVKYNRLVAEWQGLTDGDPRKDKLEREIKATSSRRRRK